MAKTIRKFLALLVISALSFGHCYAAGDAATAQAVTCPAAGTNAELVAPDYARQSLAIINSSGATIRLAFLPTSDIPATALTDSNSIELPAGQNYSDSAPSNYIGAMECASTTSTPETVYLVETTK